MRIRPSVLSAPLLLLLLTIPWLLAVGCGSGESSAYDTGAVLDTVDATVGWPDTGALDSSKDESADTLQDPGSPDGSCSCPADHPTCQGGACSCTSTSCGSGQVCDGGTCVACDQAAYCGVDCVDCIAIGRSCDATLGACVACVEGDLCGPGSLCVQGACSPCTVSERCGDACDACPGDAPLCSGGQCLCAGDSCPSGSWCAGASCEACADDEHCGPGCFDCASQGLSCVDGSCGCALDTQCQAGSWCDAPSCLPCEAADPLHCGASCAVCEGATPKCQGGVCACTPDSCTAGTPYCRADGSACVACLSDEHCAGDKICVNEACIPPCQAEGCVTDLSPNGNKCSTAEIVGRLDAFAGFHYEGDTGDDDDKDDLDQFFGPSECWDAQKDHMFRIYLKAGETVSATADPQPSDFDIMMKLYRGVGCQAATGEDDLIGCFHENGDGKTDSFSWTADADGWYSLVVDGRRAGSSDGDYGPYTFDLSITCVDQDCCCF